MSIEYLSGLLLLFFFKTLYFEWCGAKRCFFFFALKLYLMPQMGHQINNLQLQGGKDGEMSFHQIKIPMCNSTPYWTPRF